MTVMKEYDKSFFDRLARRSGASAAVVVPLIKDLVRPESVLDVGCGTGAWLAEWERQGVTIYGIDAPHVDKARLQIDSSKFMSHDLEKPFDLGRRFDLVQCLETAEHLDESSASTLVKCLGDHADTVLFSAAIPGQKGVHHVNEQWPSYWVPKFTEIGFTLYDVVRPVIWRDTRVQVWFRQNMLLFSRTQEFESQGALLDMVHPDFWMHHQNLPWRKVIGYLPNSVQLAVRSRGWSH
jgi:SAM-dependent methyltransferase